MPRESAILPAGSSGPFLLSGYAAANDSPGRGYLYWPRLHSRFDLSPLAASEIRRRVRWLLANCGAARRVVWGLAKAAGMVTPISDTDSPEWDDLVEENFMERAASPEIFDISGKFDFWTVQPQMDVNRWRDGDCLVVPTSPEGYDGLQLAFYEGPQITDSGSIFAGGGSDFFHGCRTDPWGKHLEYRLQDGVDAEKFSVIPARNAYYYANLENHNAVRGISLLAACVVNMVDVVETRGFTKRRIKEGAQLGRVIEADAGTPYHAPSGGFSGQVIQSTRAMPDGTTRPVSWEMMQGGGMVPALAPGQKIKTVSDDRPGPAQMEFEKALFADCAHAVDWPVEALFNPGALKGGSSRYILAEVRRWVANQFRYKARFVRWYRALHIANEIKAGRLPVPREDPKKPLWWLKTAYVGQADMTVDAGREGNLALVNLQSGTATWSEAWGQKGIFWKRGIRQRVKEMVFARAECAAENFSVAEVFPALFAGSGPAPAGDIPPIPAPAPAP